jgi:hypothetical protein
VNAIVHFLHHPPLAGHDPTAPHGRHRRFTFHHDGVYLPQTVGLPALSVVDWGEGREVAMTTDRSDSGLSLAPPAMLAFVSYPTPPEWFGLPLRSKVRWLLWGPMPLLGFLALTVSWFIEMVVEIHTYGLNGERR